MRWYGGVSIAMLWFFLQGCARQNDIVGTWKDEDHTKPGIDVGMKFNADKTGEFWFLGAKIKVRDTFRWRLDGDRLYQTMLTHTKSDGVPEQVTDPEGSPFQIKWRSADEFDMIDPPELGRASSRFTRVK